MKEERKLLRWIKEHKKELIIAGVSITMFIAIVLGIKKRESIKVLWDSFCKTIEKPIVSTAIIPKVEAMTPVVENVAKATLRAAWEQY